MDREDPFKDFLDSYFFTAFIILKKSQTFFHSFYYSQKIFPSAAGFYYFQFFWAQILTSEKLIFRQKSRFCLVKHPKKFACGALTTPDSYYSKKKIACGELLLFSNLKKLKIFSPAASYMTLYGNALLNASNLSVDSKQVVSDQ